MSRERPLLFSAPMVRAILSGQKTQTRRLIRNIGAVDRGHVTLRTGDGVARCPLGNPGDRIWVRETFAAPPGSRKADEVVYRADVPPEENGEERWARRHMRSSAPWTPAIHMPRWASRVVLEVTEVRVERLQAITDADARAEGLRHDGHYWLGGRHRVKGTPKCFNEAREAFASIWDELYGDCAPLIGSDGTSWASNPWVWVLTFRVATEQARATEPM